MDFRRIRVLRGIYPEDNQVKTIACYKNVGNNSQQDMLSQAKKVQSQWI